MSDQKKILWVDDSPMITKVGEKTVAALGHVLITATSGEEALKKLKAERVDLIISDLTMPGMGGMEFIRRVKAELCYANISVLVASADSEPELIREAKNLGVKGWLAKPIDENILTAAIKKTLG